MSGTIHYFFVDKTQTQVYLKENQIMLNETIFLTNLNLKLMQLYNKINVLSVSIYIDIYSLN